MRWAGMRHNQPPRNFYLISALLWRLPNPNIATTVFGRDEQQPYSRPATRRPMPANKAFLRSNWEALLASLSINTRNPSLFLLAVHIPSSASNASASASVLLPPSPSPSHRHQSLSLQLNKYLTYQHSFVLHRARSLPTLQTWGLPITDRGPASQPPVGTDCPSFQQPSNNSHSTLHCQSISVASPAIQHGPSYHSVKTTRLRPSSLRRRRHRRASWPGEHRSRRQIANIHGGTNV